MAELGNTTITGNLNVSGKVIAGNVGENQVDLSGLTATVAELNYCDGVTSNIQTQLNAKATNSHGTHVSYGTSTSALGTSSAGTASTVSRSDHVHALPALTSCTGTLSVAKGGTGATTFTSGVALIGAGTGAVTTRSITNNTSATYLQQVQILLQLILLLIGMEDIILLHHVLLIAIRALLEIWLLRQLVIIHYLHTLTLFLR